MKELDLSRPIQLRNGGRVRLLAADLDAPTPLVFAHTDTNTGRETVVVRRKNGRALCTTETPHDVINVPETNVAYVNMGTTYSHEDFARRGSPDWPVFKVEFEGDSMSPKNIRVVSLDD